MSASSTPTLISKSTEKMKLVLTKDNRVLPILSKPSPGNVVTKATTTPLVPKKLVTREAPPKLESNATCAKPIVVPSVPNLLSILNGQSTLSQFFSATSPPTSSPAVPPYISTAPPTPHSTVPRHTHSTTPSRHIKPIASFYDKVVQQHTQATLTTHPKLPTLKPKQATLDTHPKQPILIKPKKDSVPTKLPAKLPKIPKKVTNSIAGTTKSPQVRQPENGVNDIDIQPPKPKKANVTGNSSLPLSRVRTIMKTHVQSSQNIVNTGQESVAIITRATVSVLLV